MRGGRQVAARWPGALAVAAAAVLAVVPSALADSAPPLPQRVAALGDSITAAWGSGGARSSNWADSWALGTDGAVASHYVRLGAAGATLAPLDPAAMQAAPGKRVDDPDDGLVAQAQRVPDGTDLVLIGGGSADLCTAASVADATTAADFQAAVEQALDRLTARLPGVRILVSSIPNWSQLRSLPLSPSSDCALLWSDPSGFDALEAQYDDALAAACSANSACRYDGGAAHGVTLTRDDVSTVDDFHPSVSGQAKLAAAAWGASWWSGSSPVPAPPDGESQFGNAQGGFDHSGTPGAAFKFGSLFPLSLAGKASPTRFHFFASGGSGNQTFVPVIYGTDGSGSPDALVAQGAPVAVAANAAPAWFVSPLQPTAAASGGLAPGSYLLGLLATDGGGQSGALVYSLTAANGGLFNLQSAGASPSDPFGPATSSADRLDVLVDYLPLVPPAATRAPSVAGSAQEGQTLSGDPGAWTGTPAPTLAASWQRLGSDGSWHTVATSGSSYRLAQADVGAAIRLEVTATNGSGVVVADSQPTERVAPAPAPPPPPSTSSNPAPQQSSGGASSGGGGGLLPDLRLTMAAGSTSASPGDTVAFTLTVTDLNRGGATDVVLVDELPAGATLVSARADRGPGCSGQQTLQCRLDFLSGDAPAAHVTLLVRLVGDGTFTNSATVRSAQADASPADNSASATVVVGARVAASAAAPRHPAISRGDRGRGPLRLQRSHGVGILTATLAVDDVRTVAISARATKGGARLPLLARSRFGASQSGRRHLVVYASAGATGRLTLKLRLPLKQLVRGRAYVLHVADATRASSATVDIAFRP